MILKINTYINQLKFLSLKDLTFYFFIIFRVMKYDLICFYLKTIK